MTDLELIHSVADISRHHCREQPDKVALVFGERRTTYRELDERASRVANGLLSLGLAPGSRVGYLGKNQDRFWEVLLGAFKSRTVLTGINWRLAPAELTYVIRHAECRLIFVGEDLYPTLEGICAELGTLKSIVALDGIHRDWESYERWTDAQLASDPMLAMRPDDDVVQIYSSGTTGRPKGVCLTNGNFLWGFSHQIKDPPPVGRDDVCLLAMPNFHVSGIGPGIQCLGSGARGVVAAEPKVEDIVRLLPKERVTQALMVPAVIQAITQKPDIDKVDFSSLKRISYGGSPIAEAVLSRAMTIFGCDFIQNYGLSETCSQCTFLHPRDHDAGRGKLRSCGKPAPGREVRVVDGFGKELPAGQVGEIIVRGGLVMRGYWKAPEATAEAIVDGWFHTGDAGYFDEDGYLYISDRVKEMIVSGGENVYPAEVENALASDPDILDVAVIGVPDERWGEAVKAVVVLKPGVDLDARTIIDRARDRIAGYKLPKSIDFVASIPRNASGKILRKDLRAAYWAGHERQVN